MKTYCFDVDECLEISAGPVKLQSLMDLQQEGHIIGLCGNWAKVTQLIGNWHRLFSFIGPMEMTKEAFLIQLKTYVPCEEVVMVGNIQGVTGRSDDAGAALRAKVRFIMEKDFASGVR